MTINAEYSNFAESNRFAEDWDADDEGAEAEDEERLVPQNLLPGEYAYERINDKFFRDVTLALLLSLL